MERRNFAAGADGDVDGAMLLLLRMRSVPLRESRCLQHSALNHGAKQTRFSLSFTSSRRSIHPAIDRSIDPRARIKKQIIQKIKLKQKYKEKAKNKKHSAYPSKTNSKH